MKKLKTLTTLLLLIQILLVQTTACLNINSNTEDSLKLPLFGSGAAVQPPDSNLVVFEDWTDVVTQNDFGFNDFNGNCGDLGEYGKSSLGDNQLVFKWDFEGENEVYAGRFFSFFGLTDSKVTYNGASIKTITWNDYFLNFNNIEGDEINSPFGEKQVTHILSKIFNPGSEKITLKFEIGDVNENKIFRYFTIYPGENDIIWDFRNDKTGNTDLTKSKLLSLIVEERHNFYNILNPNTGEINIDYIKFETLQNYPSPTTNDELLTMIQFRAFQYFVDYVGKRPENLGLVQDRSTFPDLFTVGGQGFAFAAWLVGIKNGWIEEAWVKKRVLNVLNLLSDPNNFGPAESGTVGYKGFFYHFLGPDGKRKRNFDWPETAIDESKNTVELSLIDTGILLWGIYAIQTYFSDDQEINNLCQKVIDNVNWHFLLDDESKQFFIGWQPEQNSLYSIPASDGGFYSNKANGEKLLADYYSDEYLMCILAGMNSNLENPVGREVYDSLLKEKNQNGTIMTYPGALFTYQFLQLFYPAHKNCYKTVVDWFGNSSKAILETKAYCDSKKQEHEAYEQGLWGLSACEGPSDRYFVFGAAPVAKGGGEDDGTIAIYPIVSSLTYPDVETSAMQQLWTLYNKDGVFHMRMGFADAVHYDILETVLPEGMLRNSGKWLNRSNFAIDAGPMVMAIQNYKDGFIWDLIENNKNVQAAINALTTDVSRSELQCSFELFPNPAKNYFTIQFTNIPNHSKTTVRVYNETGQTVYGTETVVLRENSLKIETGSWTNGIYHIIIQNNKNSWHRKLMVN